MLDMVSRIAPKNPANMRLYLKEWREHSRLTQEHAAELMGTTKGTVSRMESAAREPNLGYLAAFAEIVGCTAGDLFSLPSRSEDTGPSERQGGVQEPETVPFRHEPDATPEEIDLAVGLVRAARAALTMAAPRAMPPTAKN